MMTRSTTPGNQRKLDQLQTLVADLLRQALKQGFYGKAGVELNVQDGTIQHIRCSLERVER